MAPLWRRAAGLLPLSVVAAWVWRSWRTLVYLSAGDHECAMTWSYPTYAPVALLRRPSASSSSAAAGAYYALHAYREGWDQAGAEQAAQRVPALFIPGNGGSYRQVRSLGSVSAALVREAAGESASGDAGALGVRGLEWFAADFGEELGAFDGACGRPSAHLDTPETADHRAHCCAIADALLQRQAAFVADCVAHLRDRWPARPLLLIGHSMGGVVARAAMLSPRVPNGAYALSHARGSPPAAAATAAARHPHRSSNAGASGSVAAIVTLATPHAAPPWAVRPGLSAFYEGLPEPGAGGVALLSISGGVRDVQVPDDDAVVGTAAADGASAVWLSMSDVVGVVPKSADHQAIVWCNELLRGLVAGLLSLAAAPDCADGAPGCAAERAQRLTAALRAAPRELPQSEVSRMRDARALVAAAHAALPLAALLGACRCALRHAGGAAAVPLLAAALATGAAAAAGATSRRRALRLASDPVAAAAALAVAAVLMQAAGMARRLVSIALGPLAAPRARLPLVAAAVAAAAAAACAEHPVLVHAVAAAVLLLATALSGRDGGWCLLAAWCCVAVEAPTLVAWGKAALSGDAPRSMLPDTAAAAGTAAYALLALHQAGRARPPPVRGVDTAAFAGGALYSCLTGRLWVMGRMWEAAAATHLLALALGPAGALL